MALIATRRSPSLAQRLSDRRRTLALVGLAAAAVFAAAKRRKRGGSTDFASPPPSAPKTSAPPASPPPPSPPAPTPIEPEAVAATAGPAVDQPPEPASVEDPAPEPEDLPEPNTEELAAAEIAVLAILSQEGRLETDRTALAVATTLERETVEVAALLRKLKEQGHVAGEEYTGTGERIWNVTEAGSARVD